MSLKKNKPRGATIKAAKHGSKRAPAGALSTPRASWLSRTSIDQRHAWSSAMARLNKSWGATLVTIMVIAIALSLPAGLHVMIKNIKQLVGDMKYSAQISVFVHADSNKQQIEKLRLWIEQNQNIDHHDYVSPKQALTSLQNATGIKELGKGLHDNPLPHTFILYPKSNDTGTLDEMVQQVEKLPDVETVQLETEWLNRVQGFIELLTRLSVIISAFLIAAMLLVTGNTIRLLSHQYRDEIMISKLVGATNRYVKRPFLYTGLIYGLVGSLLTAGFIFGGQKLLEQPISHLSSLYHSNFALVGLNLEDFGLLLAIGLVIGYGGAWMAVTRFLRQVQ